MPNVLDPQALTISKSDPATRAEVRSPRKAKAVVVHAGARDAYQLAMGLYEAGLLETLVTDLFWPTREWWTRSLSGILPSAVLTLLRKRSTHVLPGRYVKTLPLTGLGGILLDKLHSIPFAWKQQLVRSSDATLGRSAGRKAKRTGAGLISYSYTGFDAFRAYGGQGMLFQAHPHPATMRRILMAELRRHPECAASLHQEWELSLPENDYQRLVQETTMASHFMAASSFTKNSLVENGIAADRISVVPYGVDLERFHPSQMARMEKSSRLKLLFVGRINQRKGVKYLLEALQLLRPDSVELTICGRVLDDLAMFKPFESQVCIRPSVCAEELVRAYQAADLFVFPSVGEGFGQVLLEALASGVPILSTTHTAAPDLITDGIEGFVVEPGQPHLLAERIDWAVNHRAELDAMRVKARARAEQFTWQRFRTGVADAARDYLEAETVAPPDGGTAHV